MRTFTQFVQEVFDLPPGENLPSNFQTGLSPGDQQVKWDARTQTPKIDDETMMKIVGMSIVKGMNSVAISRALGGIYSSKQINRSLLRYGLTKETRSIMRQAAEQRVGTPSQGKSAYPWANWQDEEELEPETLPQSGYYDVPVWRSDVSPPPRPQSDYYDVPVRRNVSPIAPSPPVRTRTPEQEARHQKYLASKGVPRIPDDQIDPTDYRRMVWKERRDFAAKFGVSTETLVGSQIINYYGGGQWQGGAWQPNRPAIQKALADQTVDVAKLVMRAQEDVRKSQEARDAERFTP